LRAQAINKMNWNPVPHDMHAELIPIPNGSKSLFPRVPNMLQSDIGTVLFQWVTSLKAHCHGRGGEFEPRRARHTFQSATGCLESKWQ
jgi:hypothetical protein